ncbi:glycoside hydrolase family 3 C-terminal domain-containing protein [Lachnospiraceae bacterium 45-W7]
MKTKTKRRITAMAMAVMMAVSAFQGTGMEYAVYAAEQDASFVFTGKFPDKYDIKYVIPEDDDALIEKKVQALVAGMTEEEKYTFLGGNGTGDTEGNAGFLKGVPRFGVPMIKMYDGPAGVLYPKDTTNPPQEQMLAATWDETMAEKYGEAVGKENVAIGGAFLLGAQLDIQRAPQFGRTKDQMGEDSYLLSSLADDLTRGMQKNGGIAVMKHYAAFAQNATPGTSTNVKVSEQALHETYLPGFESAIKEGGALGLMSSYNAINGTMASANTYLQQDVLRDMWGYDYFTITDWGGNDGYTLNKGTDIEMPSLSKNNKESTDKQVADGKMTREEADAAVDQAVSRILRAYGKGGYLTWVGFDSNGKLNEEQGRTELILPGTNNEALASLYEESNAAVQEVAEQGGVLLKNENNALPLSGEKSVAVVGVNGMTLIPGIGGERSYGAVSAMTSPYEELCKLLGTDKVEGQVYNDLKGTIIPTDNLYTTKDGNTHGAQRTYGTGQSEETGGVVQGQFVSNSVPKYAMEGHEIGEVCQVDEVIDFNTNSKTYVNAEGGNAFPFTSNPAYTWETYLEAPESGEYSIILQSMGARAALAVYEESAEEESGWKSIGSASGASANQGTQYYGSTIPSETGENLSTAAVTLTQGKRYKILLASMNADGEGAGWGGQVQKMPRIENKDMQVGLAWVTPSQKKANVDNAINAAKTNDTVVIFAYAKVSDPKGDDRTAVTLKLSSDQEKMIQDVAKAAHDAGHKAVVVLNNDSAVVMENWINDVDAVLEMYYPGQRGGVATAEILTGAVNPSGKLAYTIPKKDTDTLITYSDELWSQFEADDNWKGDGTGAPAEGPGGMPGFGGGSPNTTTFSEGINTGYRWYDENNVEPQFDFGHGLSYTTFAYSDMKVAESRKNGERVGYDVTFNLKNTGSVAGSEVAQIYLGKATDLPEGIQSSKYQLAGYQKVKNIQPGETRRVTIHISERSLSYWNTNQEKLNIRSDGTKDKWTVAEQERVIYVGAASDDLKMNQTVAVEVDEAQKTVDQAQQELGEVKEQLKELENTSKKELDKVKTELQQTLNTIKQELETAKTQLKDSESGKTNSQAALKQAQDELKRVQEEYEKLKNSQQTATLKKVTQNKPKSKAKKQLQVSWKTQSGASGYEVQYSLKKSMKNAETKTVKGNKTKLTLKKLKSGKTYYIRVRAYKNVKDNTVYGAYSAQKKIKVK